MIQIPPTESFWRAVGVEIELLRPDYSPPLPAVTQHRGFASQEGSHAIFARQIFVDAGVLLYARYSQQMWLPTPVT